MNLCSHDHDEVCFEGKACPLCAVKEDLSAQELEVARLEGVVKDLEKQVERLEDEAAE